MSLSFWIRDYVFLPLAMFRREVWWRNLALALSMVLFGIWHGATALFILWGAYQGLLLVAHRQIQAARKHWNVKVTPLVDSMVSWAITFPAICLGWIFFRARSLHQAALMLGAILMPRSYLHIALRPDFYIVTSVVVLAYFAYNGIEATLSLWANTPGLERFVWLASPLYYAASLILVVIWSRQESLFVYFQF